MAHIRDLAGCPHSSATTEAQNCEVTLFCTQLACAVHPVRCSCYLPVLSGAGPIPLKLRITAEFKPLFGGAASLRQDGDLVGFSNRAGMFGRAFHSATMALTAWSCCVHRAGATIRIAALPAKRH